MGEFLAYDASQWVYEATLVPIKHVATGVAKKVRRDGVRQLVVLAALACGVTHVEREVPAAQVMSVWESAGAHGLGPNVVPLGYWAKLVDRMDDWSSVENEAPMPDFDSLA